jgi:hypothetical protein
LFKDGNDPNPAPSIIVCAALGRAGGVIGSAGGAAAGGIGAG